MEGFNICLDKRFDEFRNFFQDNNIIEIQGCKFNIVHQILEQIDKDRLAELFQRYSKEGVNNGASGTKK